MPAIRHTGYAEPQRYYQATRLQVKLYQRYLDECVGRTEDAANLRERILYDFHWFSRIAIHPAALELHRIDMERKVKIVLLSLECL